MKSPLDRRRDKGKKTAYTEFSEWLPKDKYKVVKVCMFLLGIGSMLPESMLLSVESYYRKEYPRFPHLIYFVLPSYSLPNLIFLLIMVECGSKISFKLRIIFGFLFQGLILMAIPLLTLKDHTIDIILLITSYILIGINTAIIDCSILGFMNLLDPSYQQITISGQAFSGVIASILRIITRLYFGSHISTDKPIRDSAKLYF